MAQPFNTGETTMKNTTKPTHRAHIVKNYLDENRVEKGRWTAIGSVWTHKDGKGFDVVLEALPLDGRIVIRLEE
jgi:hypothetical protein